MRSEDEDVDTLRDAHREAAARLDDAPDGRVRAAVLAAAARGVDARPMPVTPRAPAAIGRASSRARHWPWSATALLLVSVMTGLVATRMWREPPERATTIASSAPAVVVPAPPAAAPRAVIPEASREDGTSGMTDAPRPTLPPQRAGAHREPQANRPQAQADRKAVPTPATPSPSALVAPPSASSAPAAPPVAAKAEERADDAQQWLAADPARTVTPTALTAMRARVGRTAEPVTPDAWVARIVQLRADGHDDEAERELDGLRRRYPGFTIPANALAPSGTR